PIAQPPAPSSAGNNPTRPASAPNTSAVHWLASSARTRGTDARRRRAKHTPAPHAHATAPIEAQTGPAIAAGKTPSSNSPCAARRLAGGSPERTGPGAGGLAPHQRRQPAEDGQRRQRGQRRAQQRIHAAIVALYARRKRVAFGAHGLVRRRRSHDATVHDPVD